MFAYGDRAHGTVECLLKSHIEQLNNQIRNMKSRVGKMHNKQDGGKNSSSKGSGRGKGSSKHGSPIKLPRELIGCNTKTASGEPMCWEYNMQGCSGAKPGERCPRGWHVCCSPGCGKADHGFRGHQ